MREVQLSTRRNTYNSGLLGVILALCLSLLFSFECSSFELLHAELPGVEVQERHAGETTFFLIKNPQLSELTVSLDLSLDNLTPSVRCPIEMIIPPQFTTAPLVVLRPTNSHKSWHYSWLTYFNWGSSLAEHAPGQLYLLPYPSGFSFRVIQGNNGNFSHTGENRFAIDFGMPKGTPVLAARDGVVVLVRDGFEVGRPDPAYKYKANEIFVRHPDGTLAEYVHLLKHGIRVKTGENVFAGQLLGLSGNSGYSQAPHLHFMVFHARNSKTRESFPILFITQEGFGIMLQEGNQYTAADASKAPILDSRQ